MKATSANGDLKQTRISNTLSPIWHYGPCASWSSIFAGALAALGVSLILTALSVGIGFDMMSPPIEKAVKGITFTAAIWLSVVQWIPAAIGGYIAGKFGKKHHENSSFHHGSCGAVLNGFLAWVLATFFVATLLTTILASLILGVAKGGAVALESVSALGGSMAQETVAREGSDMNETTHYFVDTLLRGNASQGQAQGKEGHAKEVYEEAKIIFLNGIKEGELKPEDKTHLAKIISNKAGITVNEASARIDKVLNEVKAAEEKVKEAAKEARIAAQKLFFFMFFAMVIGAIISCATAAIGGKSCCKEKQIA